jgi:hypothetical protein
MARGGGELPVFAAAGFKLPTANETYPRVLFTI